MFVFVTNNFSTLVNTSEPAVKLARLATQVSINDTYMFSSMSSGHAALTKLAGILSAEITFIDALVIGLTSMTTVVEAALNA